MVVTYGGHGMVAAEQERGTWYLPGEAADVRDVCGAGDTVFATIGVMLSSGHGLWRACQIATALAAEQVTQLGVTCAPGVPTSPDTDRCHRTGMSYRTWRTP